MSLDEFQKTWQSQTSERLSIEPDLLLRELRRNQRSFTVTIFWRDFREVGVAAALAVVFFIEGLYGGGWPSYLLTASAIWVGGFIVVDRFRRRGQAAAFGDSLIGCVNASLAEVEHQIWLLKNVFWWYLLPPGIAMFVFFAASGVAESTSTSWIAFFLVTGFCAVVFAGVYWLNQYAVRKGLEPRRQELLAVREGLMTGESIIQSENN